MKVGLSVTSLYPLGTLPKNMDGIGTYTNNLLNALKEKNVHVQEIYFKSLKETFCTRSKSQKNFSIKPTPLLSFTPGCIFSLNEPLDLLHITDYLTPKVKGIPIVSTIHDAIMFKRSQWAAKGFSLQEIKNALLIQMSKRAQAVITVSHAVVADLVEFWKIPQEKISVIYHGISHEWHEKISPADQAMVLKKYGITKPFFLTVGTLQPRKNLQRMINAYLTLPKIIKDNIDFVIVGKEHSNLTPEVLLDQIQKLCFEKQIQWLKYVPLSELRSLYQSAHVILYPSLSEGFGFPILEGNASGVPVLTSDFGSTKEIGQHSSYLVDPYSQEAIREGMIELVEKSQLRCQLIKKGIDYSKLFTWEKCAAETTKVYNNLV